jgi:hypothetical protein
MARKTSRNKRNRAERRALVTAHQERDAQLNFLRRRCSPWECDYCFFNNKGYHGCLWLRNPRTEWGVLTRGEVRAADSEKEQVNEYISG